MIGSGCEVDSLVLNKVEGLELERRMFGLGCNLHSL